MSVEDQRTGEGGAEEKKKKRQRGRGQKNWVFICVHSCGKRIMQKVMNLSQLFLSPSAVEDCKLLSEVENTSATACDSTRINLLDHPAKADRPVEAL